MLLENILSVHNQIIMLSIFWFSLESKLNHMTKNFIASQYPQNRGIISDVCTRELIVKICFMKRSKITNFIRWLSLSIVVGRDLKIS